MSFKSRQKKRAIRAAQTKHRATIESRWYLTLVTRACSCNQCSKALRDGREMVYRHTPRWVLCRTCAELEGLKPRPSVSWEAKKKREIRRRAEKQARRPVSETPAIGLWDEAA